MNKDILKFFYGAIIGIALSILFFLVVLKTNIKRNREFETSDILNIILALGVSIYLPIKLGDIIEQFKSQKHMLSGYIIEIKEIGNSIIPSLENYMCGMGPNRGILEDIILNRVNRISKKIGQIKSMNDRIKIVQDKSITEIMSHYQTFYLIISENIRNNEFDFDTEYLREYVNSLENEIITELNNLQNEIIKK